MDPSDKNHINYILVENLSLSSPPKKKENKTKQKKKKKPNKQIYVLRLSFPVMLLVLVSSYGEEMFVKDSY